MALAEVATGEPEAATDDVAPKHTVLEYVREVPGYVAETLADDYLEQAGVVETASEPLQPDLFEIPPVAETVAQAWTAPGPGQEPVSDWLSAPEAEPVTTPENEPETAAIPEAVFAPELEPEHVLASEPAPEPVQETQPVASTMPAAPAFEIPRPHSTRRRTEPVYLPENHFPRPELRRPGLSPEHRTRGEQPLGPAFWVVLVMLVLAIAIFLYVFWLAPRIAALQVKGRPVVDAAVAPTDDAHPVTIVQARTANPVTELPVTGTVQPARETALYARTTGYVKDWKADIGDHVQANQILAELDTPDVDHQLVEARATADQAKAALALAQNEADRWAAMAHDHSVSQVDADAKTAALNGAKANSNAAEAAVGRLVDIETFKEIRAPYAGTITARNLEVGALVGIGPGPSGTELFRVIQTDPVRIFVDVPDDSAPSVRPHLPAKLQVAAFPGRVFTGEVVRDAGALDAHTHTLRTEIHVANPDGALLPGTMADVHLLLFDPTPALLVPVSALVTDPTGPEIVRVVADNGHEIARFVPVKVGREIGGDVEISSDVLQQGDQLVANPPPDLKDGMAVQAAAVSSLPSLLPPKPSAPRA